MSLVLDVPVDRLATTLAPLRGPRTDAGTSLAPLPLRVAPAGDGTYEVLDGFKRLARWRREGHTHVPVVVEDAGAGVVGKARLLEANTPRRTVSPMDETRVVRSLAADDHLSPTQIAKLLGRGRGWVDRRLTLGRRLTPELGRHLDEGRLSATTASTLATFPPGEQTSLAESILRHGPRAREGGRVPAPPRAPPGPLPPWRADASGREHRAPRASRPRGRRVPRHLARRPGHRDARGAAARSPHGHARARRAVRLP